MLKAKIINYSNNSVFSTELAPRSSHQAECLIGRHPDCDLVLDGPAVSRVHGRLLFDIEQCFFTDLGSTDGSRLNNDKIRVNQRYAIAPDDVIRMGEFALIVEDLTQSQPIQSPVKVWADEEISVRCIQIIQETHDVKTFRFVSEPEQLFDFKPGQFVSIKLPVAQLPIAQHGKTSPLIRSYSISSSPSRPHTLDITVKRVGAANEALPPGVASNWLHDSLKVGMTLPIQGPFGSFNCVDHPTDKLLLISAGSGITPMMSISQWLSDLASPTNITFIHAARTAQDIVFHQRLSLLAAQHPHFQLAFTLTQATLPTPWAGYRGRLNPAMLAAICPDFAERHAFVCGPAGFMASTKSLLQAEGFPMDHYFEESFDGRPKASAKAKAKATNPALSSVASPPLALAGRNTTDRNTADRDTTDRNMASCGSTPLVEFSASGKSIACNDTDTLLDAAEQAGIHIPSGCRMGSCGACKHPIAEGEVCYELEPRGLSENERASQQVLTCIAKPVGRVVLAL